VSASDAVVSPLGRLVVPLIGFWAKPISALHAAIGDIRHALLKNAALHDAVTPDEAARALTEAAQQLRLSSKAIHCYGVFAARRLVPPRANVRSAWGILLKLSSAVRQQDGAQATDLRAAVEAALELSLYVQPTYATVADELWHRLWRRRSGRRAVHQLGSECRHRFIRLTFL
jgi:hypothetical protein